jgi:hypothetical protein
MFKKFSTYVLKKYIKWGVWRVAVCLSYIYDAWFLRLNYIFFFTVIIRCTETF